MVDIYNEQNPTVSNVGGVQAQPKEVADISPQLNQTALALSRAGYVRQETDTLQQKASGILWAGNQLGQLNIDSNSKLISMQQDPKYQNQSITPDFTNWYNNKVKDIMQNAPIFGKEAFMQKYGRAQNEIFNKANLYDKRNQTQISANNMNSIANNNQVLAMGDAQNADGYLHNTISTLAQVPMDNVQRNELKMKYTSQFADAMGKYNIQTNPVIFHKQLLNYVYSSQNGTIENSIDKFAKQYGVNPAYVYSIINSESGGNPNAQNPNSTAYGLGQITNDTAKALGIDNKDVNGNIEGVAKLASMNSKILQNNNIPVNATNLLLMHRFGASLGRKIIQANPDEKLSDVVGNDNITANNRLEGYTVGSYKDTLDKSTNPTNAAFTSQQNAPLWFHGMTGIQLAQFIKQSKDAITTNQAIDKSLFDEDIKNQITSANIGVLPPMNKMHNLDEFKTYYKGNLAQTKFNEYTNSLQAAQSVNMMATMTYDERQSKIQQARSDLVSGKTTATYVNNLIKGDKIIEQQIKNDPAPFFQSHNPLVQGAWNNYQQAKQSQSSPDQLHLLEQQYYQTLFAAEQHSGANIKLLSNNDIQSVTNTLSNPNINVNDIFNKANAEYGRYYPYFIKQLLQDKHVSPAIGMLPMINNDTIRTNLAHIIRVPYNQLVPQVTNANINSLRNKIDASPIFNNYKNSFPDDERNQVYINGLKEALTRYYLMNHKDYSGGEISDDDLSPIINSMYSFYNNGSISGNMTTRVPNGTELRDFEKQAGQKINVDALQVPAGMDKNLYGQYVNDHKVWLTNGDETGASLWYKDYRGSLMPVLGNNGKQPMIPFNYQPKVPIFTNYHYDYNPNLNLHGNEFNEWFKLVGSDINKDTTAAATYVQ